MLSIDFNGLPLLGARVAKGQDTLSGQEGGNLIPPFRFLCCVEARHDGD
jgi:hypothetical protein